MSWEDQIKNIFDLKNTAAGVTLKTAYRCIVRRNFSLELGHNMSLKSLNFFADWKKGKLLSAKMLLNKNMEKHVSQQAFFSIYE
jgi:hypothetical protein